MIHRLRPMACALFGLGLTCLAALDRPALAQTPANDPATCRELWEQVGIPKYARDDGRDSTIVCHTKYVLSHNNVTKTPDWVLERLTRSQISGEFDRPSQKFRPDPHLAEGKRAVDADYDKSRLDRGHQAASDDFSTNKDWMVESFFLSNAVPQVGLGFNRGIWKKLEELTRDLVRGRGEIYVITGPVYRPDGGGKIAISARSNVCGRAITLEPPKKEAICGDKANCEAGVNVPAGLFKILYDPGMKRANAFIMSNVDHREATDFTTTASYIRKFQTTVDMVERHTGLEFFRALPTRERRPQVEGCATMMLH